MFMRARWYRLASRSSSRIASLSYTSRASGGSDDERATAIDKPGGVGSSGLVGMRTEESENERRRSLTLEEHEALRTQIDDWLLRWSEDDPDSLHCSQRDALKKLFNGALDHLETEARAVPASLPSG